MTAKRRIEPCQGVPGPRVDLVQTGPEQPCTVNTWRTFEPEVTLPYLRLRRLKVLVSATRSFPTCQELYFGNNKATRWAVYFCFAPDGEPRASHRFTIERLRAEGFAILVVCAAPTPDQAHRFLTLNPDALIWKDLRGYDFSGYSIGLDALAQRFDDIELLVLNDSILGPLHPLRPYLDSTPWDLTGFMTSYSVEHHVISFAFYIRRFGHQSYHAYRHVFFRKISFNSQGPVSLLQETRLASTLAKSMSVGSILTPSPEFKGNYYLLGNGRGLVDAGFPFLKRSIFTKFAAGFDQGFYRECLESYGHPGIAACL